MGKKGLMFLWLGAAAAKEYPKMDLYCLKWNHQYLFYIYGHGNLI